MDDINPLEEYVHVEDVEADKEISCEDESSEELDVHTIITSKRKMKSKIHFGDEKEEFNVKKIVERMYCHQKKENLYLTVWLDGTKTWEPYRNLVDVHSDGTIMCKALIDFHGNSNDKQSK